MQEGPWPGRLFSGQNVSKNPVPYEWLDEAPVGGWVGGWVGGETLVFGIAGHRLFRYREKYN